MNSIKGAKENKSVAESLNAVVKTHLVTMSEQYNVYAKAILEMEDKIRGLKQIMLSQDFLNNVRDVNMMGHVDGKKKFSKEHGKENIILTTINVESASTDQEPLLSFFSPRQKNSLFWCFYIIVNGLSGYEYEKNYFTAEQEFKVKTIERIKKGENKQILKEHKMSKNMIESGLMGAGSSISPKILYALSLFYNVNIFYVYKNTYYEMFSNANTNTDTNTDISSKIHIIQFTPETNYYSVSIYIDTDESRIEYIENIKKTCLELDNLDDVNKPLRAISSYSLTELINIAAKMNITNIHINADTNADTNPDIGENKKMKAKTKSKTKSELYSEIMGKCL
jgi:hypothetical protein